jgi:hypothetical protein
MNGVVLRCPHCGTTQAIPGECEACHEAQVRYYCANHKPGRWLDQPVCSECGARFGVPPRPLRAPSPSIPVGAPARRPDSTSVPRRKRYTSPWRKTGGATVGDRPKEPLASREDLEARETDAAARARLLKTLEILRAAASRTRRTPWGEPRTLDPAASIGPALRGCLSLALFMAFALLLALLGMTILAGGWVLQIIGG